MGAWGSRLFDDDTACDVRDEYLDLLADGHSGSAATDLLLDRWKDTIADGDEGPVFWLALAATQHKIGRLEQRVQDQALAVLDQGQGLDRWQEGGARAVARRKAALDKVREQLLSPPPPEKRIAPRFRDSCAWEAGEVIGYRLKSGQLALLGVLGHETHANGLSPVCELVDWQGAEPPTAAALEGAGIRRGVVPPATVLLALATSHAEYAVNPIAAQQRLLADIGLIAAPDFGSPLGFDPRHIGAMTEAIHSLETGDGAVTEKVRQFARQHKPALLEPVTQFALRREQKKSELPARRVQRLKLHRTPAQPLGEWMVFRWHELDDALRDTFGVA